MKLYLMLGLLLWNLVVLACYGLDKRRARKAQWRTSEKTLLLMSLCLGGLGAFLGGRFFRHKTQKWYFKLVWYLGLGLLGMACYAVWQSDL